MPGNIQTATPPGFAWVVSPAGLERLPTPLPIRLAKASHPPLVNAERHEEWDIPDPKAMEPGQFNEVRDLIGRKVRELLDGL